MHRARVRLGYAGSSRRCEGSGYFVAGIASIIGMPPHIIIMGAPIAIMAFIASQRSFMRAIIDGSVGIIFIIMPSFVISQDMWHVIGIMPIIIGIIMPMGIMPFIIGIIDCGIIMPAMPFIIMGIGIEDMWFIIGMGIAFMVSSMGSLRGARTVLRGRDELEDRGCRGCAFRLPERTGVYSGCFGT